MEEPMPLITIRSEEHTSELQSHDNLVCRLLLEKKTELRLLPEQTSRPHEQPSRRVLPPPCVTGERRSRRIAAQTVERPGSFNLRRFFLMIGPPPGWLSPPLREDVPI